ncbi:hypothetical protein L3Q82_025218 [Scortum barcoo]|uniref:Uncharacterized protein n=1 Tax=Scortum barcoo TaxID=214431 RepID=A0ACB8WRR4_9TELE|nr:hypothetical protein L3Q82_025218 [Scortum barcoo]
MLDPRPAGETVSDPVRCDPGLCSTQTSPLLSSGQKQTASVRRDSRGNFEWWPIRGRLAACQPRQPHNIQRLEVLRADLIHPRRLATEELTRTTSVTSARVMDESTSESPASASSLEGKSVGLRRSSKYFFHRPTMSPVESRGQQLPTRTVNSVGRVLLPPSEAPDGLPESLRGRPIVLLHGLTELLPDPSFCLHWPDVPNRPSQYVWVCQVCPTSSSASGSNSPPGGDRLTAQPLSLPECPRHTAGDQMKRQQSRSSTSDLGCPGATCTDGHPYMLKHGVRYGQTVTSTEVQ